MMVVLPPAGQSLDALVAALTPDRWNAWIAGLHEDAAQIIMPKFSLSYSLDSADAALQAMGMRSAFCDDPAPPAPDFTRLYAAQPVCINEVRHKTFVQVDESGTEAAAATSVGIAPTSAQLPFTVDRPFLFAVRERFSGTILFIGRVMNPATGS